MIKFTKMTYELSVELNKYIYSKIKEFALFDSTFSEEFEYYNGKESIKDPIINNYVLAVYDNETIIGYLVLNIFIDENNEYGCNINPIIVFEPYRNKGYGYNILNALFNSDIIKEDIKYYECAIDKANIESLALFKKLELVECGQHNNYIYMRKERVC